MGAAPEGAAVGEARGAEGYRAAATTWWPIEPLFPPRADQERLLMVVGWVVFVLIETPSRATSCSHRPVDLLTAP